MPATVKYFKPETTSENYLCSQGQCPPKSEIPHPKSFRRNKTHRQTIHTMPGIFGSKTFAFKYVPQVPATGIAKNFDAATISVGYLFDCTGNFIVETRPATTGIEFVLRAVQGRIALPAKISTSSFKIVIFSGKRPFGSFFQDDVGFFWTKFVVFHDYELRSKTVENLSPALRHFDFAQ